MGSQSRINIQLPRALGDVASAGQFNRTMDALERAIPAIDPAKQLFAPGRAGAGVLQGQRFKVVSVALDYLVCNPWDGVNQDATQAVKVAKPPEIRGSETAWNGITYAGYSSDGQERTSTLDGNEETEVVVRGWIPGDEVFAERGWAGGTGVSYIGADGIEYAIEWMARSGGRMWSKKTGT